MRSKTLLKKSILTMVVIACAVVCAPNIKMHASPDTNLKSVIYNECDGMIKTDEASYELKSRGCVLTDLDKDGEAEVLIDAYDLHQLNHAINGLNIHTYDSYNELIKNKVMASDLINKIGYGNVNAVFLHGIDKSERMKEKSENILDKIGKP